MQERFLPSGRVRSFSDVRLSGRWPIRSCLSRAVHEVAFRKKLVDATYFNTTVPSTHTPSFEIAEGVKLVTPNALPKAAPEHEND